MIQFEINFSSLNLGTRSSERGDDTLANLRRHDVRPTIPSARMHLGGCISLHANEGRMISACFRHTSVTRQGIVSWAQNVILQCNVMYSVAWIFRNGVYKDTLFAKLYLSHERCARSGWWRPILIEFSFFESRARIARKRAGVSERRVTERRFSRGRNKKERESENGERNCHPTRTGCKWGGIPLSLFD